VVFVPILEYLTPGFGKQLSVTTWIAALTSLGGLFLLSGCGEAQVLNYLSVLTLELFAFEIV